MMFKGLDIETITKEDVEFTMCQIRYFGRKLGSYSSLIRDLMLAGFCMLIMLGCGEGRNISKPSPEIQAQAKIYSTSFSREVAAIEKIDTVTTKQDALLTQVDSFASKSLELNQVIVDKLTELNGSILETRRALGTMKASLANPQAQQSGGDPAAREPQETERKSQTTPLLSDSPPAVRLFVTSSEQAPDPFPCAPCERMLEAIEAGKFAGFEIVWTAPFDGQQGYPATRFRSRTSPTGWRVIYGFDDSTIAQIKANIDGLARSEVMTGPLTGAFFQYPKDSAILSQRSDLRSDNRSDRRRRRPVNSAFSWLFPSASNQW
jgi:hypothetical protein